MSKNLWNVFFQGSKEKKNLLEAVIALDCNENAGHNTWHLWGEREKNERKFNRILWEHINAIQGNYQVELNEIADDVNPFLTDRNCNFIYSSTKHDIRFIGLYITTLGPDPFQN